MQPWFRERETFRGRETNNGSRNYQIAVDQLHFTYFGDASDKFMNTQKRLTDSQCNDGYLKIVGTLRRSINKNN